MNNEKRAFILKETAELFRKQGYYGTSLSQIMKNTQTQKGTIYHYFPNGKEQLALEAIEQTGKMREEFIQDHFSKEDDAALAIYNHINELGNHSIELLDYYHSNHMNISLVSLSSEVWSSNDTLRKACLDVYLKWQELYYDKLIACGFDEETAKSLSITIQSSIEGAFILSITTKDFQPMKVVADSLYKLITNSK